MSKVVTEMSREELIKAVTKQAIEIGRLRFECDRLQFVLGRVMDRDDTGNEDDVYIAECL